MRWFSAFPVEYSELLKGTDGDISLIRGCVFLNLESLIRAGFDAFECHEIDVRYVYDYFPTCGRW